MYKFDVTTFDPSPLVGSNSDEEYRTYLPWNTRDATFKKIGRYANTGTGEVGSGHEDPQDDDAIVPAGSGFPLDTRTDFYAASSKNRRLHVKFPRSSLTDRIGVFYSTTTRGEFTVTIPTIKISETGTYWEWESRL